MRSTATTVLLVEDNPGDRRLIREMLAESTPQLFGLVEASSLAEARAALAAGGIDMALLDLGLPDSTGLETYRGLHAAAPRLPVVILSGLDNDQTALEALRLGAQDFLAKRELSGRMLVKSLGYALERSRIETLLREREEHYRTIVDFTGDWEYWLGRDQEMIYMSPSCERMTGYPPEDFYRDGDLLWNLVHPEDRASFIDHTTAAFTPLGQTGGVEEEIEFRIVKKSGEVRWISHLCRDVFGKDGQPRGRRVSNRDITERKEAERDRQLLHDAVSASLTELYLFDAESLRCRFANRGALLNLGYSPAAIEGRTLPEICPELGPEHFSAIVAPLLAGTRQEVLFETALLRASGDFYPAEVHLQLIVTGGERVFLLAAQDITERLQRSKELIRARDFYLTLFERFPSLIWRSGRDGTCNYVNRTWQEYTGIAPETALTEGWLEAIHPEERESYRDFYQLCFEHRQQYEVEYRLRRASGEHCWIVEFGRPFDNLEGEFEGFIASCFDITPRKRAEAENARLNASLEQRVAERTLELADANKELESFSYSVSHDLRAPLRSIDGFSQALLEDYAAGLDETAQDYLRRIRGASQRMAALIDDLLQLSRVSRHPLRRERVDLSALAAQILAELARAAPERMVEVHVEQGLHAHADSHLLGVVLHNLLENAWKFTSRTPAARIAFGASGEGATREYFVRDNGAGFDPTYAERLFAPFQRLHSSAEFPGTGVGLATVHRIIRRHGGEIRASGRPGEGAVFTFTLPEEG